MSQWPPTSPLFARPSSLSSDETTWPDYDGWSIAELMRGERLALPPTAAEQLPVPTPSMGARAEPVTAAMQPAWLASGQWQATPGRPPERLTDARIAAIDEAAEAEDARLAAAMRTGQWRRRNQQPYEGYAAPSPTQPAADSDLGERARLNLLDSYYRGSLFGAARLALMKMLNDLPDSGISPGTQRVRNELRKEYQQVRTNLERYDRMRAYQTSAEFGASALGQLGGTAFNAMFGTGLGHMARYGREISIGQMRFAPFGNRTGHPTGRWPHYHRGRPDASRPGHSLPRQGIGRHRPWDRRDGDISIFDRF